MLAIHLWPTIFAGAPFRLQYICRNGVPPRSRTTTLVDCPRVSQFEYIDHQALPAFPPQKCPIRSRPQTNTQFLGPPRVHSPISSTVFAQLTLVTNTHTHIDLHVRHGTASLGHLSRPGHRVIVLTRCEAPRFSGFRKNARNAKRTFEMLK